MPHIDNNDNYTTVCIFPSINDELRHVTEHLKRTHSRGWSVTALFNLACMQFLPSFANMKEGDLDRLLTKYQELRKEDKKHK